MAAKSVVLAQNTSVNSPTAMQTFQMGGRAALVIMASSFPTTCFLQTLGPDQATWININSTTYSANQVTSYDLPAGQYRLNLTGGTCTALYAYIVSVPYD